MNFIEFNTILILEFGLFGFGSTVEIADFLLIVVVNCLVEGEFKEEDIFLEGFLVKNTGLVDLPPVNKIHEVVIDLQAGVYLLDFLGNDIQDVDVVQYGGHAFRLKGVKLLIVRTGVEFNVEVVFIFIWVETKHSTGPLVPDVSVAKEQF